jgi:hypothetical protein
LVGVPIAELDAKLQVVLGGSVSQEQRNLWATVLAIKVFETELAGEKRVWELVVQKARASICGLANAGHEGDLLEKLASEVLGV